VIGLKYFPAGKANQCITVAIQNDFGSKDAPALDFNVRNHLEMESIIMQNFCMRRGKNKIIKDIFA
jgi:hypothetical protein